MRRALELAWNGWGRVAPNPLVGAVLLRGGSIVAEGFHHRFGGPHAEIEALRRCADPAGTTCVVTLEPCNHFGKTPPCVDALLAAGVARVVVAIRDPGADAGGGLARLRAAGVPVDLGVLREEAAIQNAAFLWMNARPERPFVALKVATSVDGLIADAAGRSRWISGEPAREWVQWLRAGYDAIAVGRRTAEHDDPHLTVRGPITPRVPPKRVIFAGSGELPRNLEVLAPGGPPTIVVVSPDQASVARARLGGIPGLSIVAAAETESALRTLRDHGVGSLLVEGGAGLAGSLLERDLVDRLYWIQAPIWLGRGTPAFGDRSPVGLGEAVSWKVAGRRALGEDSLVVLDRELCLQG